MSGPLSPVAEVATATEPSLFEIATAIVRRRWQIVRWAVIGAVIAVLLIWTRRPIFPATFSFVPQGADAGRSGLLSLAGQFGVQVPGAATAASPDFFARLIQSRAVMLALLDDSVAVADSGTRILLIDALNVPAGTPAARQEIGASQLRTMITTTVNKPTSMVEVSIATRSPSISFGIASGLLAELHRFNRVARQSQAAAERAFVEERLTEETGKLREAEDRLERFLQGNRMYAGSPQLAFTMERLQRAVSLRQQLVTSLTQSFEDARIREVRDTPVITVIDPPRVPALPGPRHRAAALVIGFLSGGGLALLWVFVTAITGRRNRQDDVQAQAFAAALREMRWAPRRTGPGD